MKWADSKNKLKFKIMYTPKNNTDKENPKYILSDTSNALLMGIIKGEIDVKELAKIELLNRGYNEQGKWIGCLNYTYPTDKA